jgi:protein-tyrosine-phosphatase
MADRSDEETDELPIAWSMGRLERLNGRKEAKVKTVLFLCTGNYYRSRFAEELFNHHAERAGHDWIAQSRGLAVERGVHNVGPISPFALHALKEMAVTARRADRFPQRCTADDLASADFVSRSKRLNIGRSCENDLRNGSIGGRRISKRVSSCMPDSLRLG